MMKAPRERAALTTSFMRGAISATRMVELGHQCLSHMSQMTTAVCFGFQAVGVVIVFHRLVSGATSTRLRRFKGSSVASAALAVVKKPGTVVEPNKATTAIKPHRIAISMNGTAKHQTSLMGNIVNCQWSTFNPEPSAKARAVPASMQREPLSEFNSHITHTTIHIR